MLYAIGFNSHLKKYFLCKVQNVGDKLGEIKLGGIKCSNSKAVLRD
jgi:hypothetical protein